jgi:anaerobic glycerol-3-phosphate dehydrogenase
MSRYDVVIIGEGPAGFAAARELGSRGRRVAWLAKSPSAASLSSGAWDFGRGGADLPFEALIAETRLRLQHCWIEGLAPKAAELRASAERAAEALHPHLPITLSFDRPKLLPTPAGEWRPVYAAQTLQARAGLADWQKKKIRLIASPAWRFDAEAVIRRWQETARARGTEVTFEWASWDWGLPGRDWPLSRVAARLRDEAVLGALAAFAKAEGQSCDHVLLPPLLLEPAGFDPGAISWSECLSGTDPIAGLRLQAAIRAWAAAQGIERIPAQRLEAKLSPGRIDSLAVHGPQGWSQIEADRFILASGKYTGGGLELRADGPREPLFGLPVRGPAAAKPPEQNAIFRRDAQWRLAGVRVDTRFRPLGADGRPAFENLTACGSLIGGVDYAREGIGIGFFLHLGERGAAA